MRLLAFLLAFASPAFVHAQLDQIPADPLANVDPFGFEFAQFLCEGESLKMVSARDALREPEKSVFVFLGETTSRQAQIYQQVAKRRGAVLFATDSFAFTKDFEISRSKIRVPDEESYRGFNDCFLVSPWRTNHPLTRGVRNIAFNRSAFISNAGSIDILAKLPDGRFLLAGEERSDSRVMVMSDHSPFTNQMLMHADNAILLVNTINWLSEGRSQVAFFVDGKRKGASGMNPALPPDDIPPIDPPNVSDDTKLAIANRFLREAQKENAFNRLLAMIPAWRVWQILIVASVLVLGVWLFRRLIASHAIVSPPEQGPTTPSEARARTMLSRRTLYPVATEHARQFVRRLAGLSSDAVTPEINQREVWVDPEFHGSPKRIQSEVAKLSRLAGALDQPKQMKPKHLRKLVAQIEELTAMHDAGQLRLRSLAATT